MTAESKDVLFATAAADALSEAAARGDTSALRDLSLGLGNVMKQLPRVTQHLEKAHATRIPIVLDNVLKHDPHGKQVVGAIFGAYAQHVAVDLYANPKAGTDNVQALGRFMAQLEGAIGDAYGRDKKGTEEGAAILRGSLYALRNLTPPAANRTLDLLEAGVNKLEQHEKAQVEKPWREFRNTFYELAAEVFNATIDPNGAIAGGNDDDARERWEQGVEIFRHEFLAGRDTERAFTQAKHASLE